MYAVKLLSLMYDKSSYYRLQEVLKPHDFMLYAGWVKNVYIYVRSATLLCMLSFSCVYERNYQTGLKLEKICTTSRNVI